MTRTEDPKRTSWWCTASLCSGSALLGDLLWVSRSVRCEFLCLSCLILVFLSVFIILYRFYQRRLILLYITFLVCSLFWFSFSTCQMIGQKDSSEDAYLCRGDYVQKDLVEVSFVSFRFSVLFYCVFVSGPIQCISYSYGTIQPICAESAVKHQPTNRPTDRPNN